MMAFSHTFFDVTHFKKYSCTGQIEILAPASPLFGGAKIRFFDGFAATASPRQHTILRIFYFLRHFWIVKK